MLKRSYIKTVELKTARYTVSYRCYICKGKIHAKELYYDGGHGYRAHKKCIDNFNNGDVIMNPYTRKYFGKPVDVDGVKTSCVDVRYDLPQDKEKVVSLHPNLSDGDCDKFVDYCQESGFVWERGAKRFYVTKENFPALLASREKIGIELCFGLGVLQEMQAQ